VSREDLGGIVTFVLVWGGAVFLRWFARRFLTRRHVRADVMVLVSNTIYFGLFAVAVVAGVAVAFGNGGLAFNGVLVAALLTGLGLQDLAKNYVSGFYILFERNVRVGDRLDTQGLYRGTVTDVRLRATYLRGDRRRTGGDPEQRALHQADHRHLDERGSEAVS